MRAHFVLQEGNKSWGASSLSLPSLCGWSLRISFAKNIHFDEFKESSMGSFRDFALVFINLAAGCLFQRRQLSLSLIVKFEFDEQEIEEEQASYLLDWTDLLFFGKQLTQTGRLNADFSKQR